MGEKRVDLVSWSAGLKKEHPRLLIDASTWDTLNAGRKSDPILNEFLSQLELQGRSLLEVEPVHYKKEGKRLLAVSRTVLARVLLWSFNYGITEDERFLRRAEQEMFVVAEFQDWNPIHFLDVGEMTAALAFGYDWLYTKLSDASREKIRNAIALKGLLPLIIRENSGVIDWQTCENNWNQVCFGELTLGALAIGDEEPALADRVLSLAKAGNPSGMRPYAPDGVYPEGPSYWSYGTSFEVMMIAALESALGTDWGLSLSIGFIESAAFLLQMTAPSGSYFNYSDGVEGSRVEPALFWFARRTGDIGSLEYQFKKLNLWLSQGAEGGWGKDRVFEVQQLLPLTALWWASPAGASNPKNQLGWSRGEDQPLAVFRSSWTDPNALWLAVKGGSASLSHAHMDAGSFIFEALGERWAVDLGMQDYLSLESKGIDLWAGGQTGGRWSVFRLNNRSHNVLTINDLLHRVDGRARRVQFSNSPSASFVVFDLSTIFAGQASKVLRGFSFNPDHGFLVRDEIEGLNPGDSVRWAMVTRAEISISGPEATLVQNGKQLRIRLLSPETAQFESIPADPPLDDFNAPNPETRILIVNIKAGETGSVTFNVLISTGVAEISENPLSVRRLDEWPVVLK